MTETALSSVPMPTVRRLPHYLRFLKILANKGRDVVSCTHISKELGLDPTQIRKDLAVTGIVGRPKVGYLVPELIRAIEAFLGWNNATDAILVGAGSLGRALMGFERFTERHRLNIVAAFDNDPAKIGVDVHEKPVFAMDKLPDLARRLHIRMGIIAVPGFAAQEAADRLVGAGVAAIWNFAPVVLSVPEETLVENVDLASSLAALSSRLTALQKSKPIIPGGQYVADATSDAHAAQI